MIDWLFRNQFKTSMVLLCSVLAAAIITLPYEYAVTALGFFIGGFGFGWGMSYEFNKPAAAARKTT